MASNIQAKATSFSVTVETPIHEHLVLFKDRTTNEWEDIFISRRDKEQNPVYKRNYDRCRAILKYSSSCSGKLENISNGCNAIIFTFVFSSIELLNTFVKDLNEAVETSTM